MSLCKYAKSTSIIGDIFVVKENDMISAIYIGMDDLLEEQSVDKLIYDNEDPLLKMGIEQLNEYFEGSRTKFTLPVETRGTEFQTSVWKALCKIPYGETRSYQDIANQIGNPKAVRAIGQANKKNRLPIVIPCHRVIGKNKSLTGYAGNRTDIKQKLLMLEGAKFKA